MQSRGLILVTAVGCVVAAALFWYWRTSLTYDGEVSRVEARIRKRVDPIQLQTWAVTLLRQRSSSNSANNFLSPDMFPSYVRELSNRPLFGFVMPDSSEEQAHVRVIWGSGMLGHWGLRVGTTNFVDYGSEMWRPGVYFWREMRR